MTLKRSTKKGALIRNQEYIEHVASDNTGIHKDTIKTAFNAVWAVICAELEDGNAVKMHGKGTFYLSKRSSRIGRNPATGQEYDVPEREAMAFQTSPAYAKRLRKIREERERRNAKNDQQEETAIDAEHSLE